MSKINIIPIFVPHLGCPNDCTFCNQKRITGIKEFSKEDFYNKVNYFIELFNNSDKDVELAFYGGSFTAIDRKLQFDLLEYAKNLKDNNKIDRIRISTRPDCINKEILEYLKFYGLDIIELGVQSLDDDVLKKSKRGHNSKCVYTSSKLIKDYGFTLGLQQMLGLPGDNEEKSIKTALGIISLKPKMVRIYPTLVIKNTELEEMYLNKKYNPLNLKDGVNQASKLIMLYNYHDIDVIRVGLQSTEDLQFEKDVVTGPLHDAFRELCESEILFKILTHKNLIIKNKNIIIRASNRNISLLVGQKGENKNKIMDYYDINRIKFLSDNNLKNKIEIIDGKNNHLINIDEVSKEIVEGWIDVFKKH